MQGSEAREAVGLDCCYFGSKELLYRTDEKQYTGMDVLIFVYFTFQVVGGIIMRILGYEFIEH